MMRSRAKAVGLGLALFAGQVGAAEPPRPVAGPWTPAGPTANDPIWMSPRRAAAAPLQPLAALQVEPAGPRSAALPAVPPLPVAVTIPPLPDNWQPATPPPGDVVRLDLQEPAPQPRPADPPAPKAMPLTSPRPVETPEPPYPKTDKPRRDELPKSEPPRSFIPVQHELPTAPPELMTPHGVGVPGVRGTFGSPPISLSRDYPAWRDLLDNCGIGQCRLFDPPTGGPATDRLFFGAEYLLWRVNAQPIPVLASTSVNGGSGFLNDPGTRLLLGPGAFGDTIRSGLRVRGGAWLDECGTWGIDGSYFFLGRKTASATFDSGTTPTIARPIFAPNINSEFSELVARPGFATGTLAVDAASELWGADANLRHAICRRCDFRAEVFAGYRFLSLKESLTMAEQITALPDAPNPAGTRVFVQDSFRTKNQFHGGQVGGLIERKWGNVSLELRGSVALGVTRQELAIAGSQDRVLPGGQPERFVGGLLAAGPNLGSFSRDTFSVVPEATINLGYWVSPNVKAFVGYNALYWSNVVRPGDQIDRVVNLSFVPNPRPDTPASAVNRPLPTFKPSDLWANGVQFGVELRW